MCLLDLFKPKLILKFTLMRNIFILICLSMLLFGCSSNNEAVNSPTEIVPLPPLKLSASTSGNAKITLKWTDNSTNETGFKIERKVGSEIFTLIGQTSTNESTFVDNNALGYNVYEYRVFSYNAVGNSPTYSNIVSLMSHEIPVVTTSPVITIGKTSAICGGIVSDNGGITMSSRGVVWSTDPNPTVALSTKTNDGNVKGVFTSNMSSLLPDTTYYVRAYSTYNTGTYYGDEISFTTATIFFAGNGLTDICGNSYQSIVIGNQEWMKKNLDVCKYRNGDIIPQVQDPTEWENLTTGAWCYYNNDSANGSVYGKLYNWYAVNDSRGLAPLGWHVPSIEEWTVLNNILVDGPGGKLKETGTSHWNSPNTGANNKSGFTALPGGIRNSDYTKPFPYPFIFKDISNSSFWWTTQINVSANCDYNSSSLSFRDEIAQNSGISVRCIKD